MRRARILCALLFLATAGSALAQGDEPADPVKAMLGTWRISNADGDKTCTVIFKPDRAPGGHRLEFDKTCADLFALTKNVSAWTVTPDGLLLLDDRGTKILDLDEVENGIFEGMDPDEGRYFMQNLTSVQAMPTLKRVLGGWTVSRGTDTPVCIITFYKTAVGNEFALELKPGCGAPVTDFNPTSWHLDRADLILSSAQGVWRFEEAGPTTWQRVPEEPNPLWLVRQ
jgi:Protease inhibitor Inh